MNHYKQVGPLGSSEDTKGAKNSFCNWSRSHVSKQMNVGGQIRVYCSKQWIIKQMLDLFSVLNLILLASSQPLLTLQMPPVTFHSSLNGKFHPRQWTWLLTMRRMVVMSKQPQLQTSKQQQQTPKQKKTPYSIWWLYLSIVQHINDCLFKKWN